MIIIALKIWAVIMAIGIGIITLTHKDESSN
jgi:hypothetical protein